MAHLPNVYATINTSDLALINFDEIAETSASTLRYNLANTEFIIKWDDEHEPSFISDGSVVPIQTLTLAEAQALMQTPEWTTPDE